MAQALARIRPTLNYGDFGAVDIVIEAVVENEKVKKTVLAEVEALRAPEHDPRLQHVDDLDHASSPRALKRPRTSSACTSSTPCTGCRSSR